MIKLIASDMDGTFLNADHQVSEKNRDIVDFAEKNNIDFIIATGRAHYEALPPLEKANLKCDLICFNGGITYDKDGNMIDMVPIKAQDLYYIIGVFKSLNISYQLYTKNTVYTNSIETDIQAYADLIKDLGVEPDVDKIRENSLERLNKGHLTEVDNIDLYINNPENPAIKIIGISSDLQVLAQANELLKSYSNISVTSSGINNIEVMDRNATKGSALKKYTSTKNISLNETMALGDNLNDLSMLKIVKYSVAMKNGADEVKNLAKYTSKKTNEESGVAYAIEKIVIEENDIEYEDINMQLVDAAIKATSYSYVPYSNFRVGAALLADNGKIYTGCNIENASYTPTNCAERTAIFKAVSEGITKFKKIAVVGGPDGRLDNYCPPCGVCRQVLSEFADEDFELILATSPNDYKTYNFFEEVLPLSFTSKNLKK